MGIFFTSDLHFGHVTVANLRGFDDIHDHNRAIVRNINRMVKPEDTLYILGDVAMGGWETTIEHVRALNAKTIFCILGNHDRPAPNNKNGHAHLDKFRMLGNFAGVSTMAKISHNGQAMMLSHYAYSNEPVGSSNTRDFEQFRLRDMGIPVAFGHSHSEFRGNLSKKSTPQVHVGLDAWGLKPVPVNELFRVSALFDDLPQNRFWTKVATDHSDCFVWQGGVNAWGYGHVNSQTWGGHNVAHRAAWSFANGEDIPEGMMVDHICHNRLCCNPNHLRLADKKQNSENLSGLLSTNKSGHRGVSWNSRAGRWRVAVYHHGKQYHGGSFLTKEEANVAAIALRNKLYTHNDADRT